MQSSQTKLKAILPTNHLTTIIKNQSLHALQTKMKTMATIRAQTMHPTMQTLQTKLKKQYSQKNNSSNKHQKNQHCKHYKQTLQNTYRQQITTKHKRTNQ